MAAAGAPAALARGDTHTYTGTIANTGCGWSLVIDVEADTVDLTLTDQPNCASVHLTGELTGSFDGSNTSPKGAGADVSLDSLQNVSAKVLGQQVSVPDQSLKVSYDVGVNLEQAAKTAASAQQAVQGGGQELANDAEAYLGQLVLDQLAGGATQLDFNKPLEALTTAQESFCAALAYNGVPAKPPGETPTYVNCDPPMCPTAIGKPNACTSVASDTATLGGSGGSSQDQLCPATPPQPDYLFVCVPTFVAGDFDAGKQSLVLLPGGALVASPVGGNLTDLLAGPTLSSDTAIVSLGGVVAGDNLTLKAPEIEMAAGVVELLGHLDLQGGKQVSIGSVNLGSLQGLSGDLSSVSGALQPWVGLAASAGINDAKITSLLSSASVALPMEVSGRAITVTTSDFTLGSGSKLDTQGRGGTSGIVTREANSGNSSGYFGASHGGFGGITGTLADTWAYWHTQSTRTPTYDNPFAPSQPGTGSPALPGGGVVRIDAHGGTAHIDGTIDVDGFWEPSDPTYVYGCSSGSSDCGMGAGGSVFITAGTLAGDGVVSADGASICDFETPCDGQLYDGAGGGGRIAALYGSATDWKGSLQAYGGWDRWAGGSKTVSATYPDGTGGAGTVFTRAVTFNSSGRVSGGLGPFPGGTLTVDGGQSRGWYPPPEYYAPSDATPILDSWGGPSRRLVITGEALVWATNPHFGEIDVLDGSTLTTPSSKMRLNLSAAVLNVDSTSQVTVNTRGYGLGGTADGKGGSAPGNTPAEPGAGGSHGGKGGRNTGGGYYGSGRSGSTYDSATNPHLPGGGGGGSGNTSGGEPGGGVLDLKVGKLQLDGVLSANGADTEGPTAVEQAVYDNNGSGGGAGGSVVVHATQLSGGGAISATGGLACETGGPPIQPAERSSGPCGSPTGGPGAGGGGRIAVYAHAVCGWTGNASAAGGIDQTSVANHDNTSNGKPGSVHFVKGQGTC